MNWLAAFVITFGSLTFLFPVIGALFALIFGTKKNLSRLQHLRIEVLIPAYNEAHTITHTIESVKKAKARLLELDPDAQVQITVAADGPKDNTLEIVSAMKDVKLLNRGFNKGKWETLKELAQQCSLPWCVFVDAGTIWPEDFLIRIFESTKETTHIGFAPGYSQGKVAGKLERINWWLERTLKMIENLAGGPISLHGATMVFRTDCAKLSFERMGFRSWFNDDVVLAIAMRSQGTIEYLGENLLVSDCGVKENVNESGRRLRMMWGNVEWMRILLPQLCMKDPLIALLLMRRVVRVFWIWILMLSGYTFALFLGFSNALILACFALFFGLFFSNSRLRQAAMVSLKSPLLIFRKTGPISWS